MKEMPTLADAVVAAMLDKRRFGGANDGCREVRAVLKNVYYARKFVLDKSMSEFLAEISQSEHGSLRARMRLWEAARRMARIPHQKIWIEFDFHAWAERMGKKCGKQLSDYNLPVSKRLGWLMQQHEKVDTAFLLTEIRENEFDASTINFPSVLSLAWCSDDSPLPWQKVTPGPIIYPSGYKPDSLGWTFTFSERFCSYLIEQDKPRPCVASLAISSIWQLLGTLNDLPTTIDKVCPSRGMFARGSYRKFVEHRIIHLTIPETRYRAIARSLANRLKRKAHQVRGHWRNDWRQPVVKNCKHDWSELMVCRSCGGHYLWIAEHWRGDETLGTVTHDYTVSHRKSQREIEA